MKLPVSKLIRAVFLWLLCAHASLAETRAIDDHEPVLAENTISFVSPLMRPWLYKKGDGFSGVFADLAQELGKKVGVTFKFRISPVQRVYSDLVAGKADIGFLPGSLVDSPKRYVSEQVGVSDNSVFTMRVVIAALVEKQLKGQSFEQLAAMHIGAVNLPDRVWKQYIGHHKVEWPSYSTAPALLKAAATGRIDGIMGAEPTLDATANRLGYENMFEVVHVFENHGVMFLAWSQDGINTKFPGLDRKINEQLNDMYCSRELHKLVERYSQAPMLASDWDC